MKIIFRSLQKWIGNAKHLVGKRVRTAGGGWGCQRGNAHSDRKVSHICRRDVFPGMTSGGFSQSRHHLWLKSLQFLQMRLAQVPALITITWRRNSQPMGFGSAILRWWQFKTSCSILRCERTACKQFHSWPQRWLVSLHFRKFPMKKKGKEIQRLQNCCCGAHSICCFSFICCSKCSPLNSGEPSLLRLFYSSL